MMSTHPIQRASILREHLYFAAAAAVSGFILACWVLANYNEVNSWERFFFVIGGGTAGFLWLTTIVFRGRREPRFGRAAVILPAAAQNVLGHFYWIQYLGSSAQWTDSMLENVLKMVPGYWVSGTIAVYVVLSIVYKPEPALRTATGT